MESFLQISSFITDQLLDKYFFKQIKNNSILSTTHDRGSYYNNSQHSTGFNWEKKYI